MDFVFSTDPADARRLPDLLPDAVLRVEGAWGCLTATASAYVGLDPVAEGDAALLVRGDPLVAFQQPVPDDNAATPSKQGVSTARSLVWLRALTAGAGMPRPLHPGCLMHFDLGNPQCPQRGVRISGATDASGFASVYVRCAGPGNLIVASSPDLIAAMRPCRLDALSAMEMLAKGYVWGPNTLYEGIFEIPPGIKFSWNGKGIAQWRWWTPPAVRSDMTLTEAINAMESGIRRTASRLVKAHGRKGWITLSAGMDSRYLASLLGAELDLQAVTVGQPGTVSGWVAAEVARALGLPHRMVVRPAEHYVAAQLDQGPTWPSHHLIDSAHFREAVLGEGIGPFLLGGFRADTALVRHNPLHPRRAALIEQGILSPDAPDWAGSAAVAQFDPGTVLAITARQAAELAAMGADPAYVEPGMLPLQWQRSLAKGQYDAAGRNYPMYEPYLSRELCDLAFMIPADSLTDPALPESERKMAYYGRHLRKLAKIPLNPVAQPAWAEMLAAMRKALPRALWPKEITLAGEWADAPGPRGAELETRAAEAAEFLNETFGLECAVTRQLRPSLIQIITAAERASGVTPLS